MSKWEEKIIASLGKVITGKTPPKAEPVYWNGEELFVSPKDMRRDSLYIYKTQTTISNFALEKFKTQVIPKNSVMYTALSFGFGKIGIASKDLITNQQINSIIVNEENNFHFIYYLLRVNTPYIFMYNSGIETPFVPKSVFEKIKLLVPPLPTQQKIADILLAYDDLIENNNRRIELLEKLAENLYKEWFVRFRFPNYKETKFEKGLPQEWEVRRLSEFVYVTDGTHDTPKQTESGHYLITGKCITNDFIDFSKAYFISEDDHEKIKKRSGLDKGDILFSNIGTVGSVSIIDYGIDFSVKNVIILKTPSDVEKCYLYCLLKNSTTQESFKQQTNGSSQQFISLGFMRNFKVLIPRKKILHQFKEFIEPIIAEKYSLYKKNQNLIKQRDLLLPRLMSGKLEV